VNAESDFLLRPKMTGRNRCRFLTFFILIILFEIGSGFINNQKLAKSIPIIVSQHLGCNFLLARPPKFADDDQRFETVYTALKHFKELYGNLDVPLNYRVPISADWPLGLHEYALGFAVKRIRYKDDFNQSSFVKRLEDLGLEVNKGDIKFDLFVEVLRLYKERFGTTLVREDDRNFQCFLVLSRDFTHAHYRLHRVVLRDRVREREEVEDANELNPMKFDCVIFK
jgi:hypothetical protein